MGFRREEYSIYVEHMPTLYHPIGKHVLVEHVNCCCKHVSNAFAMHLNRKYSSTSERRLRPCFDVMKRSTRVLGIGGFISIADSALNVTRVECSTSLLQESGIVGGLSQRQALLLL
jgi:hypothetical protein